MNFTKSSRTRKILVVIIIFVLLLNIAATFLAYSYFKNQKIASLSERVTSFAVALDATDISLLQGDESDLTGAPYIELKNKLIKLQEFNTDTRFIYLMGKTGDTIFFYADSEPAESEDYSPPGQIYDEASAEMHKVFDEQAIVTEVGSDRWGKWLSVMAPVIDPQTNTAIALVGFDMPHQRFLTEIILFSALPASIGLIILILLIATYINAKKDENMMQLRSEYFAIAAHDLRTPLTGIKWATTSLKKTKPISEDNKCVIIVDRIHQNTENMLSSVNELLEGSSVERSGGTKLLIGKSNLSEILQNAFVPLDIAAKQKNIKITLQLGKEIVINGDSDKLRRAFANIMSNAIKYSNDNGTIKVAVKKSGNNVAVSIKDNGIGIPASEQSKVFNGYYRATNAKEYTLQGTGLGLYYVKNIIELHGGKVALYSVPGKGTEITLVLPLS